MRSVFQRQWLNKRVANSRLDRSEASLSWEIRHWLAPEHVDKLTWPVVCCIGAVACFANRRFFHDDAFITLRYVRHLIFGQGLVWNPGERVEGYSNFLFVMCVAALAKLGLALPAAARGVNALAFGALAVFCGRYAQADAGRLSEDPRVRLVRAVQLVPIYASVPLLLWVLGGLEGPLSTLFCTLGTCLTVRSLDGATARPAMTLIAASTAFALAALARLDAALFYAIAYVWLGFNLRRRSLAESLRRALCFALPFMLLLAPWFAWRWQHYGDWLPNTFYAKASWLSSTRLTWGFGYVLAFALSPAFFLIVGTRELYRSRERLDTATWYLASSIAAQLLFVVYVGGDHMLGFRFMLPIIPMLSLLMSRLVARQMETCPASRLPRAHVSLWIACALQLLWPLENAWRPDGAAFIGQIVGEHIARNWPAGSLIALHTAGSTPYFADENRYIDMLGLNDRHIGHRKLADMRAPYQSFPGHSKGDGAYVLARAPDYIIAGPAQGTDEQAPWFLSDVELFENPAFRAAYEEHEIQIDVRDRPDYRSFDETRSGELVFTYFQRKQLHESPRR